jgi:hypothetical protein
MSDLPPEGQQAVTSQLEPDEDTLFLGSTRNGGALALTDRRILLVSGRRWRKVVSVDYERVDWIVERVGYEIFADKVSRRVVFHVAESDKEAIHALLAPRVKLTEPTTFLGQALRDWFRR